MTEIQVKQRSEEWFELRQCVQLTASRFGDALGVGQGKPYDFLCSLLYPDEGSSQEVSVFMKHGTELEPIIDEVYQLLTGNQTQETGFWLPEQGDAVYGLVGASPDGKVMQGDKCIGLVEYKAPVFKMYSESMVTPHGIPRRYMAQMQGQMAVCRMPWCDFMAVCTKTQEVMLKKVYFCKEYWAAAATRIKHFCNVLQEAKQRVMKKQNPLDFPAARELKNCSVLKDFLPGEDKIQVENLLQINSDGLFRSSHRMWMTFDLLMGISVSANQDVNSIRGTAFNMDVDSSRNHGYNNSNKPSTCSNPSTDKGS